MAKEGIIWRTLKLGIVHNQVHPRIAGRCGEYGGGLKQPIGHRVGEVRALHIFHSRLDRGRVEEIALDDFCTFLAKVVGSGIELVDESANGMARRGKKRCDDAAGWALLTAS